MDCYREELELWKKEQTRQFQEFVIEEPELENRLVSSLKSKRILVLKLYFYYKLDVFLERI